MPTCYGPLRLTGEQIAALTPFELINMAKGYQWRHMQLENILAQFVTLTIINMSGKTRKRPAKLRDLFTDGRFSRPITQQEIDELKELYD